MTWALERRLELLGLWHERRLLRQHVRVGRRLEHQHERLQDMGGCLGCSVSGCMGRGFGDGMGGSAAWAAACIPQRVRVLTLKREVDVVVPATLTMPRERAPDAGPHGTATAHRSGAT